jgi:formylmethanofuran dehydrogenase subunit E
MDEWLSEAVDLPVFRVLDTRSAQGRLDANAKTVTVADLVLYHGHACDGLLRGAYALRSLFDVAFGTAAIDRSDLLVVSKNSPCLGDVAAYLTGGRARFGTHRLDESLGVGFQVQRLSTGEAWEVREEPGFFPGLILRWDQAVLGQMDQADKRELLAVHEAAQWDWVRESLLPSHSAEHYRARALDHFTPPAALHEAVRTDVVNRLVPPPREAASRYESDRPAAGLPTEAGSTGGAWADRYRAGPEKHNPT